MAAVDRTSFVILSELTKNAQIPNKQLAAAAGLAPSSCHERVKQLRSAGILGPAHSQVDLHKLGVGMQAVIQVELRKHRRNTVDAFVRRVRKAIEVRQVFLVAGSFDLFVHVVIRDMEHLRDLAYEYFTSDRAVERIETAVVFQSWSDWGRLPVPAPDE